MATLKEILNAIPDEYKSFEATVARIAADFEDKLDQLSIKRINKIVKDLKTGKRDDEQVRSDLIKHVITPEALKERYGSNDDQVERMISGELNISDMAKQAAKVGTTPPSGGKTDADPDTLPGVLTGGRTIKVNTGDTTRYYQMYEFPPGSGQFISYQFNNRDQVVATLGPDFDVGTMRESVFNQRVLARASAEEVVGLDGDFRNLSEEMMREAAERAGVRDPGMAGRIASNREMQRIMAQAIAGDWTPEQIRAEQRNTSFWKNELYPGIEAFYDQTADPERAWAQYVQNVSPALTALGYEKDSNGAYSAQIKEMLDSGIDDEIFLSQVPTFLQAQQNSEFAAVLNQWAERDLGRSVDFNDWFDLLAGESMPELESIAERARLAHQSQQSGAGLTNTQVARLADRTDLTQAEAQTLFTEFNQALLALGDSGLKRGGLDREEILSAYAGVDPGSGRSIEEVKMQAAKLARENDLFDEDKINFYIGFNNRGAPVRPGLEALAPEGA